MNNIIPFNNFVNENNSKNEINADNIEQLKDKLIVLIATEGDDNLRKGLDFAIKNIEDYNKDTFVTDMCNTFFNNINNMINKKYPKFWSSLDKGYSGNRFTGSNYERTAGMDIKELAKLIKEELNIYFPDWKFSVKISRYSGGQSMRISIVDMPYTPFSKEVDYAYKNNTHYDSHMRYEIYNEQYLKDYKKIKSITEQYNFDDSDTQSDYFHVRYYAFVDLDSSIKEKFYPENDEVKKHKQWDEEWKERAAKKKAEADEIKKRFKFKKGQEVIYIYDKENPVIPKGEYDAVILKAPNGRTKFANYDIRFSVTKRKLNGTIVDLKEPMYYKTSLYGDDKLKEKGV